MSMLEDIFGERNIGLLQNPSLLISDHVNTMRAVVQDNAQQGRRLMQHSPRGAGAQTATQGAGRMITSTATRSVRRFATRALATTASQQSSPIRRATRLAPPARRQGRGRATRRRTTSAGQESTSGGQERLPIRRSSRSSRIRSGDDDDSVRSLRRTGETVGNCYFCQDPQCRSYRCVQDNARTHDWEHLANLTADAIVECNTAARRVLQILCQGWFGFQSLSGRQPWRQQLARLVGTVSSGVYDAISTINDIISGDLQTALAQLEAVHRLNNDDLSAGRMFDSNGLSPNSIFTTNRVSDPIVDYMRSDRSGSDRIAKFPRDRFGSFLDRGSLGFRGSIHGIRDPR